MNQRFKTAPMAHQLNAFDRMEGRAGFALLMEQGTGKTKVAIDDAARCWGEGKINAMLVIAPNGVHTKWVTIEIPKHMPDWCPYNAQFYSAGSGKKRWEEFDSLFDLPAKDAIRRMPILAMSYDALATNQGKDLLDRFTKAFACYAVIDESQRIKNPKAIRTKALDRLRPRFPVRRILSGTPVTKSPFDIFSQFHFLDTSILRTSSYTAFKSEYADMLPDNHYLVRKLQRGAWAKKDGTPTERVPQIIARGADEQPIYRNLDKLQRLIAPHSFRVLKKDCLDLPEKIYDSIPFELTERQRGVYDRMYREHRAQMWDVIEGARKDRLTDAELHELIVQNKLSAMAKLQQITCGYLKMEDGEVVRLFSSIMDNPRNVAMMDVVEDIEGSIIFWAPHTDKIDQIVECLETRYPHEKVLRYDGAVKKAERMQNVDDFQAGHARFFVGNPASGGVGLTLTAAETAIYYSNSFDLEHRLQSEDRNHRIGTTGHVRYYDLEAINTIDRKIVESNQMKKRIADTITGDDQL